MFVPKQRMRPQPEPARSRLAALDGLRGLLAVVVVLQHATSPLHIEVFRVPSEMAVLGFFVMSGLVLTRAWRGRLPAFLAQRAVRLWPTYACCLGVGFALAGAAPDWRQFLFYPLTMIAGGPKMDPPAWSLIIEAWTMPLMPLIVWAGRDRRRTAIGLVALLAASRLAPDARVGVFLLALACFVTGAHLSRYSPRAGWLETAPMQWLGKISYSLYLIHWPLLALAMRLFGPTAALCALPLAFPLGYLVWAAVERPSILLARRVKVALAQPRIEALRPGNALT